MRKNKHLIIGLILVLLPFILINCNNDFEKPSLENNSEIIIQSISFKELQRKEHLKQKIEAIKTSFDISQIQKNGIYSNDGSFTILTDTIIETINQDSIRRYSFLIETPTDSTSVFENFVIKEELDDEYSFWILRFKYNLESFAFDITYQQVDENQININDFDNYLKQHAYFVFDDCLYISYWIYYKTNGYWGWSTPLLVTCGGGGGSGSSGGSSNNDPDPENPFEGGSIDPFDTGTSGGSGNSGNTNSGGTGINQPATIDYSIPLAGVLSGEDPFGNSVEFTTMLAYIRDSLNILQVEGLFLFLLENNLSEEAISFVNLVMEALENGNYNSIQDYLNNLVIVESPEPSTSIEIDLQNDIIDCFDTTNNRYGYHTITIYVDQPVVNSDKPITIDMLGKTDA